MKIKEDFVTNSSGVSFIASVRKNKLNKLLNLINNGPVGQEGEAIKLWGVFTTINKKDKELSLWIDDILIAQEMEHAIREKSILVYFSVPRVYLCEIFEDYIIEISNICDLIGHEST